MNTRNIQFKREVRILGLDACRKNLVVGAILRGGTYLDGVMNFSESFTRGGRSITEMILESQYYPELRFIMSHDPRRRLHLQKISRATSLPFIEIRKTSSPRNSSWVRFRRNLKTVYTRSNIQSSSEIEQLIKLSWTFDDMPEPVRVAHLLVKSIPSQHFPR